MAKHPIELSRDVAEKLVAPYPLEEILELLVEEEIISYYMICSDRILVWANPEKRLDIALLYLQHGLSPTKSRFKG